MYLADFCILQQLKEKKYINGTKGNEVRNAVKYTIFIPLTVHCKYIIQVQISRLMDLHAQLKRFACALVTPSGENIEYTASSFTVEKVK